MTSPTERTVQDNPRLVWTAGIIVAAIGAWIMFDAIPGANWGIWTAAASIGLISIARDRGALHGAMLTMLATATILAAGAAVTADPFIGLICLAVILFLSLAMLLVVDPGFHRISALFVVASPFVAGGTAVAESFRRVAGLSRTPRSSRAKGVVRGIAITLPVVLFFALLLSNADPIFAIWRDNIERIISTWSFIPRTIFFFGLLTIALGAYSFAATTPRTVEAPPLRQPAESNSDRWLGTTERLILISAVTALFWLFIAVQLSYLFGNVPSIPGSGMTFAEYAQHGFGELTLVATCSVVLILASERYGRNDQARNISALTIALLTGVMILLGSAFRRVLLYEAVYGFTVSRLYAQVYMIVLAVALLLLALGVLTTLDTRVLFRRVFATATAAFMVLVFWNHEAWIASANIDRYRSTGKLDVKYLVVNLSPNAVPIVVSRLAIIAEPQKTELHDWLIKRYDGRYLRPDRWFEWNYRRQRAREALAGIGLPRARAEPVVVRSPD